jgi:hypothetical protein
MNTSASQTPQLAPSDEIDLRELVRALWDTRVPVLLAVATFAVLFWLAVALLASRAGFVSSWDAELRFVFPGVEEGQYREGSPFSSSDLLASVIVNRVYDLNELDRYGLRRSQFANALSIAETAPNREFIVRRFEHELGRQGLSSAERNQLESEFTAELERASRGNATLSLVLTESLVPGQSQLPDSVARKILLDIPRVWAEYMTTETGLFAANLDLYSVSVVDRSIFRSLDFMLAYEALKEKFGLLSHNFAELRQVPSSVAIVDAETGMRLNDLQAVANELEAFVLEDTLGSSAITGAAIGSGLIEQFFRNRVAELERRRNLLQNKARQIEVTLNDYSRIPRAVQRPAVRGQPASEEGFLGGVSAIPQFGSDFLNQLVQLGGETGDVQFRQELSRERLDLLLESVQVNSEIERLNQLLNASIEQAVSGQADAALNEETVARTNEAVDNLVGELRDLFLATERLANQLSQFRQGGLDAIYSIARPPSRAPAESMVLTRSNLQRFVLGAVLIAILTVFGVFIRNMVRSDGPVAGPAAG